MPSLRSAGARDKRGREASRARWRAGGGGGIFREGPSSCCLTHVATWLRRTPRPLFGLERMRPVGGGGRWRGLLGGGLMERPHTCLITLQGQAHTSHTPLALPLRACHAGARQRTLRSRVSQAEKLAADRVSIEPVQEKQLLGSFFRVRVFTFQRALPFKGFPAPINTVFIRSGQLKKAILDKDEAALTYFYLLSIIFLSSILMILPRAAACSKVRTLARRSSLISSR